MRFHWTLLYPVLMTVVADAALAQQASQSQGKKLSEVTWTKEGAYEWVRPPHVRYILVRACGGGGGGGGGYSIGSRPTPDADGGTAVGGGGGAGAAVATALLGPLTADRYQVVIGRGGNGGRSKLSTRSSADPNGSGGEGGTPTSFAGDGLSFETPGGPGGGAGKAQSRMSAEGTMYEFFVTRSLDSGGVYPGGGAARNGARGLLGLGGIGNAGGYSGGGGGSLTAGGAGGGKDSSGTDGAACAGGGGAGYLSSGAINTAGGRGGAGSLTLVSVASPVE
jgi:hypothetical protein